MRYSHSYCHFLGCWILLAACLQCGAQSSPALTPGDRAQRQVLAYVAKLADLHCAESVVQQKLNKNGRVEVTDQSNFDYLIMMQGDTDGFQMNESRIENVSTKHKALPLLVTNGFSTLMLIFHPYYRDSFRFETGPEQIVNGRQLLSLHFAYLPGTRAPAALALRGREYALELEGTAWLDSTTGDVVSIEAALMRDMSDVGLHSLRVHVEYKLTNLGKEAGEMMLPSLAVIDVETPRQHWRNTHSFTNYRTFSTDSEQEPNVKVHPDVEASGKDIRPEEQIINPPNPSSAPTPREKP